MLSLLSTTIMNSFLKQSQLVQQMDEENTLCETFFKEVENWRNLQITYSNKLNDIVENLKDKGRAKEEEKVQSMGRSINLELAKMLECVVSVHRKFLAKMNYDVMMVNVETAQKLTKATKKLLDQQRSCLRQISSQRQSIEKVLQRKERIRRAKQQELMLQIFMNDSIGISMDQKIRKLNKVKELEKELQEYGIKVTDTIELYRDACARSQQNQAKLAISYKEHVRCRAQTVMKIQLHYSTFCKGLTFDIEEMAKNTNIQFGEDVVDCESLSQQFRSKASDSLRKWNERRAGYMQCSLNLIFNNTIDELIDYSKDREVKSRIKRMMESTSIDPQETDELTRQVLLIRKILSQASYDKQLITLFRAQVVKSSKLRMNFVFIMQFYRINSQFEITSALMKPMHLLITEFLLACHETRDAFVIRQFMVLLMTYYVVLNQEKAATAKVDIVNVNGQDKSNQKKIPQENSGQEKIVQEKQRESPLHKSSEPGRIPTQHSDLSPLSPLRSAPQLAPSSQRIYLIHFYKDKPLWRDMEYWESILLECIYQEKRNTMKMMMGSEAGIYLDYAGSQGLRREFSDAERSAIVNQILMVVRNMIIFELGEKEVKSFAGRFIKLLKQDDKCTKDVNKTIEEALKEEHKLQTQLSQSVRSYMQLHLSKQN